MIKDFFGKCKDIVKGTIKRLKGHDKRVVLASIAEAYGHGGQSFVAKEFNVGRDTIRKGFHEVSSGAKCGDAFNLHGINFGYNYKSKFLLVHIANCSYRI